MWWSWKNALNINNIVNVLELLLLGIIEISNSLILYSIARSFENIDYILSFWAWLMLTVEDI